ncbi:MAG: transposase [Nitrososphaerota archaeon]|jgi:transposase|nr:transposase [Nitrososphaerota archaeon]
MQNTPQPILDTLKQIKNQENTRIELRKIKNHYYAYKIHTKWNKQTKKTQKTTQYIGSITPNGQYKPKQQKTTTLPTTKIYEYGSSQLLMQLSKDLQQTTQNLPHQNELIALSITRALNPSPIRLTQPIWEDTYTSTKLKANLTPTNITTTLTTIGHMIQETYTLFHDLSPQGGMLFYDLTSILSHSKNLKLAEKGYNPQKKRVNQIKIALAFSTSTYLPTAIDVFYGSIKEIKVLKYFIERFPSKDIGFVMDRGFTSYEELLQLQKEGIHYIVALKKNSTLIPLDFEMSGVFEYGKRNVAFCKVKTLSYGFLYLFSDPELRAVAEDRFLGKVRLGVLSMGEFCERQRLMGVFGLLSDLDVEPGVVYEQYKVREEIEQAFDFMKNDLEADRSYLGCDDAVRGYFVVVFLAMRLYFKILQRLREHKLVGVVSVREVLLLLSKMRMIVEKSGHEYLCALPKKTEEILEVFKDLLPKTCGLTQ